MASWLFDAMIPWLHGVLESFMQEPENLVQKAVPSAFLVVPEDVVHRYPGDLNLAGFDTLILIGINDI